jgi:hypothetical protein
MQGLIDSIDQSLATGNWYAALAVALTIPDVCASLEAADGLATGPRYAAWFDKYLGAKYYDAFIPENQITGGDCYALRCSLLHNASDDITSQRARKMQERFRFRPNGPHLAGVTNVQVSVVTGAGVSSRVFPNQLGLSVRRFCEDLRDAARTWLADVAGNALVQQRLSELMQIHPDGITGPRPPKI